MTHFQYLDLPLPLVWLLSRLRPYPPFPCIVLYPDSPLDPSRLTQPIPSPNPALLPSRCLSPPSAGASLSDLEKGLHSPRLGRGLQLRLGSPSLREDPAPPGSSWPIPPACPGALWLGHAEKEAKPSRPGLSGEMISRLSPIPSLSFSVPTFLLACLPPRRDLIFFPSEKVCGRDHRGPSPCIIRKRLHV